MLYDNINNNNNNNNNNNVYKILKSTEHAWKKHLKHLKIN